MTIEEARKAGELFTRLQAIYDTMIEADGNITIYGEVADMQFGEHRVRAIPTKIVNDALAFVRNRLKEEYCKIEAEMVAM